MNAGLNTITHKGVKYQIVKAKEGYNLRMLSTEKVQPIEWIISDNPNEVVQAKINANYFNMSTAEHLGVEISDLYERVPRNNEDYTCLAIMKNGTIWSGYSKDFWYSKNDCYAAFTPYRIDNLVSGKTFKSKSFSNKDNVSTACSAVMYDGSNWYLVATKSCTANQMVSFGNYLNMDLVAVLDGGGSTQLMNGNEHIIKSSRKLPNVLALIEKDEVTEKLPNNYEKLQCPFPKLKITQFENGSLSHKGSLAWDITDGVVGSKAPYYAPCDMKCVGVDKTYAFVWWESLEKVEFADGTVDYLTLMVGHDNTINVGIGFIVRKGQQLGNMGTGGNAAGVHCHIECAKGKFTTKWLANKYGVYCLPNSVILYDVFYMDNVEIINTHTDERKVKFEETIKHFKYTNKKEDNLTSDLQNQLELSNSKIEELQKEIISLQAKNDKLNKILNTINELLKG